MCQPLCSTAQRLLKKKQEPAFGVFPALRCELDAEIQDFFTVPIINALFNILNPDYLF